MLANDHSAILEIHRSQQVREYETSLLRQAGGLEALAQVYSRVRLLDQSQESLFKRNIATRKRIALDRCPGALPAPGPWLLVGMPGSWLAP